MSSSVRARGLPEAPRRVAHRWLRVMRRHWKGPVSKLIRALGRFDGVVDSVGAFGVPCGHRVLQASEMTVVLPERMTPTVAPSSALTGTHPHFVREKLEPEEFVARLGDGVSTDDGYIMDRKGVLLPEASIEFRFLAQYPEWPRGDWSSTGSINLGDFSVWDRLQVRPRIDRVDCRVASLTTRWQMNYYHWLFEVLPRLYLLERAKVEPDRLYVATSLSFQKETLRWLGVEGSRVIDPNEFRFIRARELVVPSVPGIPGFVPKWACDFLRDRFLSGQHLGRAPLRRDKPRMIYIGRRDANRRRMGNEEEVRNVLEPLGVSTVFPEHLPFSEQVRLFSQADVVVAPHGAGLSNAVFCRPGTSVVEVFSPEYVNPCFWSISQAVGLDYHYLIGDSGPRMDGDPSIGWPWAAQGGNEDIDAPIEELRSVVASISSAWKVNESASARDLNEEAS